LADRHAVSAAFAKRRRSPAGEELQGIVSGRAGFGSVGGQRESFISLERHGLEHGAGYDRVRERVVALLTGPSERSAPSTRLVRLPVPASLADVTEQLHQVQRQKSAALAAGDEDAATVLRLEIRRLRAEKLRLEHEWAADVDVHAVIAENQRVHRELDRLRGLLRQHGIEPDDGAARTA
jgi:hypothetical protein